MRAAVSSDDRRSLWTFGQAITEVQYPSPPPKWLLLTPADNLFRLTSVVVI